MEASIPAEAQGLIDLLGLEPHPEGGFYAETHRARESLRAAALPLRYDGERAFGTAIYLLLADRAALEERYPKAVATIRRLTR